MQRNINLLVLIPLFGAALTAACAAPENGGPEANIAEGPGEAASVPMSAADEFAQAAVFAHRRHYSDAIRLYKDLIARKDKILESYENLARVYLDQRDFMQSEHLNRDKYPEDYNGEALEMCEEALKINPSSAKALAARGELRMNEGDLKGAIEDLRRADEIDKSVQVKYLISAAYTNLGNTEEAAKFEEEAKKEDKGGHLLNIHK